ncbi:hypothetical protein [Silvimonas iriomotensis]|uniref:hypothetical protein n=1 Tax=Silvimonas iriomotensis TaxID=449662 RepID=UPI0016634CE4|nr:hypothetical protein [Silvimonas iriomotensis]
MIMIALTTNALPEQKVVKPEVDTDQIKVRPSFAQRNPAGFSWLQLDVRQDIKTSPERK